MTDEHDIAIVGMACVFPKAPSLARYWENNVNGVDALGPPPPGRWTNSVNFQLPRGHEAFLVGNRGGFIPPEFQFDPIRYGVQPHLVRHGDPDQFLMLHLIDRALVDARVGDKDPVREQTDVIIGRGGYLTGKLAEMSLRMELIDVFLELIDRRFPEVLDGRRDEMDRYLRSTLPPRMEDSASTAIANLTASRAANRLNLRGTAYVVDGACASSLLAVEQAVWRLRNGQCDLAVAGGLFLHLAPTILYVFSQIGALSASQMIRPFDRRADGLIGSEGGGTVVLKRFADACRDGDSIYAVIKGIGSASDGRDVDVMAPSHGGQLRALEKAYDDAGLDRDTIGYLETHGTGTILGDLTEIATIKAFFGKSSLPATARAMGSVKSMIGHTMPAAGMASLIRTSLALSHKTLPPSLHCEEPRTELVDAPFYWNVRTRPWVSSPQHGPRRAGVNAFGFGGINAHVVLEEFRPSGKPGGKSSGRPAPPTVIAQTPGLSVEQKSTIQRVAVVGAGCMGAGIAHAAAAAGFDVILRDIEEDRLHAALQRIQSRFDAIVASGELSAEVAAARYRAIQPTIDGDLLRQADLAIETVSESEDVKRDVFRELDRVLPPHALLVSNTSALQVRKLAASTGRPAQVAGLHFFNPIADRRLVEIVRTPLTSAATLQSLDEFVRRLDRTPLVVADGPGFLVNRILFRYVDEAIRLVCDGWSAEQIDEEMRRFGMRHGPLELLDLVGLDVAVDVIRYLLAIVSDSTPGTERLEEMVRRGWLGVKSGRGFYEYAEGQRGRSTVWEQSDRSTIARPLPADLPAVDPGPLDLSPLQQRLLLLMINEASRCLQFGVVDDPAHIDLALVHGIGFPAERLGAFHVADTWGISAVTTRLETWRAAEGERFAPSRLLRQMDREGRAFFPRECNAPTHATCRPLVAAVERASELLLFSAASQAALDEAVHCLRLFVEQDQSGTSLTEIASTLSQAVDWDHPCKLAWICRDLAELRERLNAWPAAVANNSPATAKHVQVGLDAATPPGKLAVVFPGMAFPGLVGEYPDRLMQLLLHFPELRAEFDGFENRDGHPDDPVPTSSIFSPPATVPNEYRKKLKSRLAPPNVDEFTGKPVSPDERSLAPMGTMLSDWIGWLLIQELELPVDALVGQSVGELAAVCAAGIAEFHDLAPRIWKTLDFDTRDKARYRLAYIWAPAEVVEPLVAQVPDTHMAIYASPESVVIGGSPQGIRQVSDELRRNQILVQGLPFPPIHTPALTPLREQLDELLAHDPVPISEPRVDLYSSITTQQYTGEPRQIRENLLSNIDCPVRIWPTLRRMYDDGVRVFVQVGVGHMATHLDHMLPPDSQAVVMSLDAEGRDPLTQLHEVCATLFTHGVRFNPAPLFAHRELRSVQLSSPQPGDPPATPLPQRATLPLRTSWTPLDSPAAQRAAPQRTDGAPAIDQPNLNSERAVAVNEEHVAATLFDESAQHMPVLGTVTQFTSGEEVVIERLLDLREDRYLLDHRFVYAPNKPAQQCLPILPLTMSLEFCAEAASLLAAGLTLIGFESVRALRWIGLLDESAPLRIEARLQADDPATGVRRILASIHTEQGLGFSAVALFAAEYRVDLDLQVADPGTGTAWPFNVSQVYGERFAFHGPAFQCISGLPAYGNPASSVELTVLPRNNLFSSSPDPLLLTDPVVMDGLGQAFGIWAQTYGQFMLPVSIDKLELYRPPPAVGTRVILRIEVTRFDADARQVECNMELEDGSGAVWLRVAGWCDWLLRWPLRFEAAFRLPQRHLLSDELQLPTLPANAICTILPPDELANVNLDWASRMILHEEERAEYLQLEPGPAQRRMLLSRMAVKDAARLWMARRDGTELLHPSELWIVHDEWGRPALRSTTGLSLPDISLAHTETATVALAGPGSFGIDIEPESRDVGPLLAEFATDSEIALVQELTNAWAGEVWETRLWCAKEAASKAQGAGLQGRPKSYQALHCDADGTLTIEHVPTGSQFLVHTLRCEGLVLAHTAIADPEVAATQTQILQSYPTEK